MTQNWSKLVKIYISTDTCAFLRLSIWVVINSLTSCANNTTFPGKVQQATTIVTWVHFTHFRYLFSININTLACKRERGLRNYHGSFFLATWNVTSAVRLLLDCVFCAYTKNHSSVQSNIIPTQSSTRLLFSSKNTGRHL